MSQPSPTRRNLLFAAAGLVAAPAWSLELTPQQTAGPFYPWRRPQEGDNDLTRVTGQRPAKGEHGTLRGQLLDTRGNPVSRAMVEIWQCDANGRYHHVDDGGRTELDQGFQGWGRTETSDQGKYAFRTIKPVPYGSRTPHIHLRVRVGRQIMLNTQIYERNHRRNRRDAIFDPATAVVFKTRGSDDAWTARFNPVIRPRP